MTLDRGSKPAAVSAGPTPYDALPYISGARAATSIDRLATIGKLLGMNVAPPGRSRVLELGCGDGGNLIPMAVSFPQAEFTGLDLAPTAIQRGERALAETGIGNVRLVEGTFTAADAGWGQFDYIIVHGIYSWVPEATRDELMGVIRDRLAPHGVAFVSYNALPGSHIRGVLRDMMRLHTREISEPAQKVAQARALLSMLMRAPAEAGDIYRPLLQSDIGKALQSSDFLLYHDDLADISQPFFFSDFVAASNRHALQFAAEANFYQMSLDSLPPELAGPLAELGQRDLIAKEQYLDFLTCRSFRQTLLCHADVVLDRAIDVERVRLFRFASDAKRVEGDGEEGLVEFRCPNSSMLRTDNLSAIAALDELSRLYPRSLAFDELASLSGAQDVAAAESLAEILFRAFSAGVVEFRLSEPSAAFELSERPVASPWARFRAGTGHVVNLYHQTVAIDDAGSAVIALLDGAHTVTDVARELGLDEAAAKSEAEGLAARALLVG